MKYRQVFTNEYLQITTQTNSRRLHELIDHYFDFRKCPRSPKPKIKIKLYLQEINPKHQNRSGKFIYQSWSDNNRIFSVMGAQAVSVTTDLRRHVAKTLLLGFDESFKELTLDLSVMQPIYHILGRHGLFMMHASMVSKNNASILISGPKGSGKSTLALTLARSGFQLLSDDDCFVQSTKNKINILPFMTKMGLNEKILKRYPEIAKEVLQGFTYGDKRRISLKNIAGHYSGPSTARAIIFSKYRAGSNIRLHEIAKQSGVKKLIAECPCVYPEKLCQHMIWTIYALAKQVRFFELSYNDKNLDRIPAVIERNINL